MNKTYIINMFGDEEMQVEEMQVEEMQEVERKPATHLALLKVNRMFQDMLHIGTKEIGDNNYILVGVGYNFVRNDNAFTVIIECVSDELGLNSDYISVESVFTFMNPNELVKECDIFFSSLKEN